MSSIQIGDRVRIVKDNPKTGTYYPNEKPGPYQGEIGTVAEVPGQPGGWDDLSPSEHYVVDFSHEDWDVYLPEQIEKVAG